MTLISDFEDTDTEYHIQAYMPQSYYKAPFNQKNENELRMQRELMETDVTKKMESSHDKLMYKWCI